MRHLWLAAIIVLAPFGAQAADIGPHSSSDDIRTAHPTQSPALKLAYSREETGEVRTTGTITLAADFNAVTGDQWQRIDDFALCRVLTWWPNAREVDNQSCYAMPAFRIMELQNRQYLAGLLTHIDNPDAAATPFLAPYWSEQELAVQTQPVDHLVAKTVGDQTEWQLGSEVVVRTSTRGFAFSDDEKPRVARYFARFVELHPQVRRAILLSGQWPDRIEIQRRSGQKPSTLILTFSGAERAHVDYPLPAGLASSLRSRSQGTGDEAAALRSVLAVVDGTGPQKPSLDSLISDISATASQRPMAAVMTFFGMVQMHFGNLQGNSPGIKKVRGIGSPLQDAFKAADAAQFMQASELAGKTGKGPEREAAALYLSQAKSLDALPYGAFRYVTYANLSNYTEDSAKWDPSIAAAMPAIDDCFWRFIAAAPWAANTYKDLGDILYKGYEMNAAWEAWDLGRAADPDWETSMMKGVPDLEARLRRGFPDQF